MSVEEKMEFERLKYGEERINYLFELGLEFEKMILKSSELWGEDLAEVIEKLFSGELETHKKGAATIEHNQKVKILRPMADFLEQYLSREYVALSILMEDFTNSDFWDKYWVAENENNAERWDWLIVDAVRYGYEVEEEPRWDIPILSLATSDGKQQFLTYDEEKNTYFASRKQDGLKQEYTKEELRRVPDHFKHYAIPVEKEVAE